MTKKKVEILVVGAGLIGSLVADLLVKFGKKVSLLEAGPMVSSSILKLNREPFQDKITPYLKSDHGLSDYESVRLPFEWIRVRASGGKSLLWGGWCTQPASFNEDWPFETQKMQKYYNHAKKLLNIKAGILAEEFRILNAKLGIEILPKSIAAHPNLQRPITGLDFKEVRKNVKSGRYAKSIEQDKKTSKLLVTALNVQSGKTETYEAKHVFLTCSAFETAKLLSNSENLHSIIDSKKIGKSFADHCVGNALAIYPKLNFRDKLSSYLAFQRDRSAYIPLSNGFIELGGSFEASDLPDEVLKEAGIASKEKNKFCFFKLHSVFELTPGPKRKLSFENGKINISCEYTKDEKKWIGNIDDFTTQLADQLMIANGDGVFVELRSTLVPGGIGHESSTFRMERDGHGPISAYGKVRGLSNLWISDASVMPSSLPCHPTWTLAALAIRQIEHFVSHKFC